MDHKKNIVSTEATTRDLMKLLIQARITAAMASNPSKEIKDAIDQLENLIAARMVENK